MYLLICPRLFSATEDSWHQVLCQKMIGLLFRERGVCPASCAQSCAIFSPRQFRSETRSVFSFSHRFQQRAALYRQPSQCPTRRRALNLPPSCAAWVRVDTNNVVFDSADNLRSKTKAKTKIENKTTTPKIKNKTKKTKKTKNEDVRA